jgi:anti-anti-sigma factor
MIVRSTTFDNVQRVRFEGGDSLDYVCAPIVKRQCAALIREELDVVVDLSSVEFVDSAGLGTLIGLFKAVHRRGRRMLLVGVRPEVLEVMEIIRLDEIFLFAGSFGEAVEHLRAAG